MDFMEIKKYQKCCILGILQICKYSKRKLLISGSRVRAPKGAFKKRSFVTFVMGFRFFIFGLKYGGLIGFLELLLKNKAISLL